MIRLFTLCFVALGCALAGIPSRVQAAHPSLSLQFANVQVSRDSFPAHSEPAIAMDPRNHQDLVAGSKFFSDPAHYQFKIGTYYSTSGGRSWHDSGLLPGFKKYGLTSDISIAFSRLGVAYVAVLATRGNASGIFVSRSTDGGKTFSAPSTVFWDSTGASFSDKPWIAVDDTKGPHAGTIYVAWNLDSNTDEDADRPAASGAVRATRSRDDSMTPGMVISRSTDGGETFSPPTLLAPFTAEQFYLGAIPQVGPRGQVYVAFAAIGGEAQTVTGLDMVASTDGGVTFSAPRTIQDHIAGLPNLLPDGTFRNYSLPTFAVSAKDGSMVVAWADMRNGDADILATHSTDGGVTWSDPVRVNHDRLGNGKDQFQPALAAAPDGVYTCAWFDRRHDPNDRLIDEDVAQSTDDGASFGHNFRVTQHSWDPSIGAPVDPNKDTFIGDYQGLAVDNTTVHPLWNDTQNGTSQQIRTAVIAEQVFLRRK